MPFVMREALVKVILGTAIFLYAAKSGRAQTGDLLGITVQPAVGYGFDAGNPGLNEQYYQILPRATVFLGVTYRYSLDKKQYLYMNLSAGRRSFTLQQRKFDVDSLDGAFQVGFTPVVSMAEGQLGMGWNLGNWQLRAGPVVNFNLIDSGFYVHYKTGPMSRDLVFSNHYLSLSNRMYAGFGLFANVARSWVSRNGRTWELGLTLSQNITPMPRMILLSEIGRYKFSRDLEVRQNYASIQFTRYFGRVRTKANE